MKINKFIFISLLLLGKIIIAAESKEPFSFMGKVSLNETVGRYFFISSTDGRMFTATNESQFKNELFKIYSDAKSSLFTVKNMKEGFVSLNSTDIELIKIDSADIEEDKGNCIIL